MENGESKQATHALPELQCDNCDKKTNDIKMYLHVEPVRMLCSKCSWLPNNTLRKRESRFLAAKGE